MKKGVKNIQVAAYNGARMVIKKLERKKGNNRKHFPKLISALKIDFECQIQALFEDLFEI